MAKILLVDTNVSSFPFFNYLNNSGYEVFVVGGNPNDYLAKSAKNYIQIDYSDIKKINQLIEKLNINYLVPGCNDQSYKVCVSINSDGRFPGLETKENNEILNNKNLFRSFATKYGLPVPKVYSKNELHKINYPVLVKPVDAYSGHGITIIQEHNLAILDFAVSKAIKHSRSGSYLIEEYVSGQLYSHSAFIANCSVICDVLVEEHCIANPFAVDTSRVLSNPSENLIHMVRSAVQKMAYALKLCDGLVHTQFILKENSIWLIEPTRRCPGDLYSRLIELSTDLNYAENYVRPFLGKPHRFKSDSSVKKLVMRHTITDPNGLIFGTLCFNEDIKISEYVAFCISGDFIKPAPFGRVGIFFASYHDCRNFENIFRMAINRTLYKLS